MLVEASTIVKGKLDGLSAQEKGVDIASGTIQSLMDFVERNIENATEEELMVVHTQMLNRIDEETENHKQSSADLEPIEEEEFVVSVECAEELKKLCQEKAKICISLPDPAMSTVQGDGIKTAEVNKSSKVTLYAKTSLGTPCTKPVVIKANLTSFVDGSVIQAKIQEGQRSTYNIDYTPTVRGRHQLNITMNNQPIAGSPFPVFVNIPPTQLGKPVKVFSGLKFRPYGIAINSRQELVIAMQGGDIVFVDKAGNQIRCIKGSIHGLKDLYGVVVDDEDSVYVADAGRYSCGVYKFDNNGEKVVVSNVTTNPRGIALSGERVVVVAGNKQLLYLSRDLELMEKIPLIGTFDPYGVACDEDDKAYICDYTGNCIQVINAQGQFLYSFNDKGHASSKLNEPYAICVHRELVFVAEWGSCSGSHRVSAFTKEGKYVTSFENKFQHPSGLVFDDNGFMYVSDMSNSKIHIF